MSRLSVPIGPGDHVLGPPDAGVSLVEYGDYECPFCGRAHGVVANILRRFGDDLLFCYRDFPLAQAHPHALMAAQAAEAAGAQGAFWPMHDTLFENQEALELEDLLSYAQWLNLDVTRFGEELQQGAHQPKVANDFRSGVRSGVNGTPTFFLNGTRFDLPWDFETLSAAIESAKSAPPFRRAMR
jgi:protein-disulfide isomerase